MSKCFLELDSSPSNPAILLNLLDRKCSAQEISCLVTLPFCSDVVEDLEGKVMSMEPSKPSRRYCIIYLINFSLLTADIPDHTIAGSEGEGRANNVHPGWASSHIQQYKKATFSPSRCAWDDQEKRAWLEGNYDAIVSCLTWIHTEMLCLQGYMRCAEALVLDEKPKLALDTYAKGLKKVSPENVQHLVSLYSAKLLRSVSCSLRELLSLIVSRYWNENAICFMKIWFRRTEIRLLSCQWNWSSI